MHTRNLVIGLAAGYHYGDVAPFLRSLERVGHAATECVLFASDTTRDVERMERHGTRVIRFRREPELEHVPYNGYRYRLYRDYLRGSGQRFRRVLMTDVRDVLFQHDPFSFDWPEGLNATLEDESMTIGSCPHNSRWVERHLGRAALVELSEERISCSGTTVADHDTLLEYLDAMISLSKGFRPGQNMAGFDQAIHNYLIRKDFGSETTFHDNAGPILTLGYHPCEPETDPKGDVLNDAGEPAVIVHQYDRKPGLFAMVRKRYGTMAD
ncbi:hypothetical protein [Salidesulfovibrio brasiliensis]|uniref:hypothetical protein n=1 Tax=Salidesulfovibrio brasiliensis TaxID=221711 RepID=UPI0006D0244A|nr:hypothetical protein [Salidesulfovibrio brasiliensis]